MTKRIISIILAAVMLLSFPAFAEDTEQVVKPDSGNMLFAKAMGIVAADAVGANIVTRLDLATMFCNIMRTDVALAPSQAIQFTDVPDSASTVVAHVANLGIMNGVGGGLFAPDAPVTYVQAIKAMVTFLGYAQNAEAKNGYPFGYYSQAMELGLTDGAPKDINAELTYEKAVALFKLAINVDYREPVAFNPEVKYEITENLTYLHYHRDIVRVRGTVKSTSVYDISGMGKTAYNKIRVNSYVLNFNPANVAAHEFFGYNVDAYVEVDSEEILFIEDVGTDIVELNSTEISGLVGSNIEYYNEAGKVKKLPINTSFTRVLYNGTILQNYTPSDINPFPGSSLDGGLTAIDNDADGVYDIVCVDAYETYVVERIVGNKIYAENTSGIIIDLDALDYKEGEGFLIFNILGEPVKLSDIKDGDTVSVSKDKNGTITQIVVTIDKIIGVVNAVQTQGGKMYVTVNGGEFECSNRVTNAGVGEVTIGKKACIKFNKDGLVSDIDQETYSVWNIGYLTGYGATNGMDPELQVKIFGEDGKWYVYNLADKILVTDKDNKDVINTIDKSAFITNAGTDISSGLITRQPILYKLNADSELKEVVFRNTSANIETTKADYENLKESSPLYAIIVPTAENAVENTRPEDGNGDPVGDDVYKPYTGQKFTVADGSEVVYHRNDEGGFDGKAFIDPKAVYFKVPAEDQRGSENKYSVASTSLGNSEIEDKKFELYCTDPYPMVDVVVLKDSAATTIDVNKPSAIIKSIKKVVDESGNTVTQIEVRINDVTGAAADAVYTDPENVLQSAYDALTGTNAGTVPGPGDILRFEVNNYNEITIAEPGFSISKGKILILDSNDSNTAVDGDNINSSRLSYGQRYTFGTVTYRDSSFIEVTADMSDGSTKTELYPLSGHTINKVTKDARGNITVEDASAEDIVSNEYGTGSTVFVHLKAMRRYGIVIYEGF